MSVARPSQDTIRAASSGMMCPQCRATWVIEGAPLSCPTDRTYLVRAKDFFAAQNDPMIGQSLEGRYTIVARLGAGSMGTVYRAKQHAMGREVAIKILRNDRATDDSAKARFLREARANSLLASPHTVTVFDFGQSANAEFYLAMEMLEGEPLGQRLQRIGRLSVVESVDVARQALRSLGEAHAKGIIHRDLKPDNLFFARVHNAQGSDEIVKVLDFGIAKMMRDTEDAPMNVVETQAGTVFGTPRFMSPEQAQGKPLDARSDLYSLGVLLYQMLTGRPPFTDDDAVVVMARHIKSIPKRPSEVAPEAAIPREVEDVVMRLLAKEPEQRPRDADAVALELTQALESAGSQMSGVRLSVVAERGSAGGLADVGAVPSWKLALVVLPLAALVGAFTVFVLQSQRIGTDREGSSTAPGSAGAEESAPARPLPTTAAAPTSSAPDTLPSSLAATAPPVLSAEALPRAKPAAAPAAKAHGGAKSPRGSAPAAPSPSASSPYGIFD